MLWHGEGCDYAKLTQLSVCFFWEPHGYALKPGLSENWRPVTAFQDHSRGPQSSADTARYTSTDFLRRVFTEVPRATPVPDIEVLPSWATMTHSRLHFHPSSTLPHSYAIARSTNRLRLKTRPLHGYISVRRVIPSNDAPTNTPTGLFASTFQKDKSMAGITQGDCGKAAKTLYTRRRRILGLKNTGRTFCNS